MVTKNEAFGSIIDENSDYIEKLNSYRMEWLHRIAGGAEIYSDKSPASADTKISIQVPIDPKIPSLETEPKKYLKRIEKIKSENDGQWLIEIDDFANYINKNTKHFVLKLIEVSIKTKL